MVWASCLNTLHDELPESLFSLWIRPLVAEIQGDALLLIAPNPYFVKHITDKFLPRIQSLVDEYHPAPPLKVMLRIDSSAAEVLPSTITPSVEDAVMTILPNHMVQPKTTTHSPVRRTLNQAFTFDLFVEGKSNQMAAQTCHRVLEKMGDATHNPLFLYGPTGLGKTHLMQAVGNQLLINKPNARVMYMTSEQFQHAFVGALRQESIERFKRELRSLDLLLVDDIHMLAGKKATLEEFFYTFNTLIDDDKQIILTSDRYPKDLTELDARLVSRFSWGLSVAIEPPDINTRIGILLKKSEKSDIKLTDSCAHFIAQHVMANVRELEGALNKVMAMARFRGHAIDIDLIKESLKDVIAIRARTIGIDNIKKTVADYFSVPMKELVGQKRTRIFARPRQIAMGLSRELTNQSFPEIGQAFGGRDHTTVMHAVEKVRTLCETDAAFAQDYQMLLRLLQN